jgi:hypothetical protein
MELEVYDLQGNNVARGKKATASSVYGNIYAPQNAVDGNRGTMFSSGGDAFAWLQIDLGRLFTVREVKVVNRNDCCKSRLSSAQLTLFDTETHIVMGPISLKDTSQVSEWTYNLCQNQNSARPGYVDIFVDSGNGYKMETIANKVWNKDDVVLNKCFGDIRGVQVKGPNNDG